MSTSKKTRSQIGMWVAAQAPLAPPRESVRIVKPNALGDQKVITRVNLDAKKLEECIDAIEKAVTMALIDENGKTTFTVQMIGAAETILAEKEIKVQGSSTVSESVQNVNAALVGLTRDIALDLKAGYGALFEEAKGLVVEMRSDRNDWQNYCKELLTENAALRAENATLKSGTNPEQEGKGMLYTAAASTLIDLPALIAKGIDAIFAAKALAAAPKTSDDKKELAELSSAQKNAVDQVKQAAAKICDRSILKIIILLTQNQEFAAQMANQMSESEKAAMKPAFVACLNAIQELG